MVAVQISAVQSVSLFGWFQQPILTLSWHDVKHHHFTWRQLRSLELPSETLKKLQPDKHEWLQRGGIQVSDLLDMIVFPVNPLTDFGVDLAELWQLQCLPVKMASMGITMDHLFAKGMTPEIMAAFAFSLSDWLELQFGLEHANSLTNDDCLRIFVLEKKELLRLLQSFAAHGTAFSAKHLDRVS
jgi:hypothetical protein